MLTAGAGPPPTTDCAGAVQCCHVLAAGARVYPHAEVAPCYTSHIIIYIHLISIAEWFSLVVNLSRRIKIEIYHQPSTKWRAGPRPGSAVPAGPLLILRASLSLPAKHKTLPTLNLAGLRPCRLLVSTHCCLGPASMLNHEDSDSNRTTVSSILSSLNLPTAHLHSPISHIHKYFENTTFCRYLQDRSTI